MGDFFSVKTYGAVGDGTTDDRSAIQAAIDATPSSGGVVFFPPGTYKVVATLNIDKPLEVLGSGPHATVVSSAHATSNVFETSYSLSASGNAKVRPVIFRDIRLDASVTRTAGAGILFNTSTNYLHGVRVSNVHFAGHKTSLKFMANASFVVDSCTFWSAASGGTEIYVENAIDPDAGDNTIVNSFFFDTNQNVTYAIYFVDSAGLRVHNCKFLFYDYHLYVNSTGSDSASQLQFTGNSSEFARVSNVRVGGTSTNHYIHVTANHFTVAADKIGINVETASGGNQSNSSIANNSFAGNALGGNTGVRLSPVSGATVAFWRRRPQKRMRSGFRRLACGARSRTRPARACTTGIPRTR